MTSTKRVLSAALLVAACGLSIGLFRLEGQVNPAPEVDRVGFPEGYRDNYFVLYVFDRPDNRQVRVIYGNEAAARARPGEPFSYGSILVMETYEVGEAGVRA